MERYEQPLLNGIEFFYIIILDILIEVGSISSFKLNKLTEKD